MTYDQVAMNRVHSISSKNMDSFTQGPAPGENAPIAPPQSQSQSQPQPGQPGPPEHQSSRDRNQVFKSGPLFISSKGIGWTSWKKRWFVLTRTSLVFFRSDPSAASQKGGEMNLTLGGIDLNNSASVEVKADKKLLTVLFPDGRDGRAFTLKAETLDDLYEWKTALETALAQAPTACAIGQGGMFNNEQDEGTTEPAEQQNDRLPGKSMVIGRPVLLALEDIDGSPSFLEKALRFIELHGVRVEGILRQAADVELVYRRVHEYEQGKTEFSPDEDAHVIADCIKYILRELPSSPVPATCCTALLEAFKSDRNNRLNNMRTAILETFPEPNRRLLQRILLMMQHVAEHKTVNRMSVSAVAACMSPLLLRPLLAGECELEKAHMDVAGDSSFQLLQAAAAANHAQAIVITLLEEYDNIFGEGSITPELFSDSEESYTETENGTDDDEMYEEEEDDDDDAPGTDGDSEQSGSETCSGSSDHEGSDSYDDKKSESSSSSSKSSSCSSSKSHKRVHHRRAKKKSPSAISRQHDKMGCTHSTKKQNKVKSVADFDANKAHRRDIPAEVDESGSCSLKSSNEQGLAKLLESASQAGRPMWGRTPARKNPSVESIDFTPDDEEEIQRLEDAKTELKNQIAEKAKNNATLQANLGNRKKDLHERRLALEKDVARLQDQLQKEKDIGAALESGDISRLPAGIDEKTKAEIKEILLAEEKNNNLKQRVNDLGAQINQQRYKNAAVIQEKGTRKQESSSRGTMSQNNKGNTSKDTSHHVERSSKNEGQRNSNVDVANRDKDGKKESPSNKNQNQNQHQQNETSRDGTSNLGSQHNSSPAAESSAPKSLGSSFSKKSGKGEGGNSTTLSKLTNRLNFLKERRNQIASELENLDKGKGSSTQFMQSSGKGKGLEENQGREGGQEDMPRQLSSHTSLKGMPSGSENKDGNNKKGSRSKLDKSSTQNSDKERKSENQPSHYIDRLNIEGQQSSKSPDKGRQHDSKHSNTSSSKVTR